MISFIPEGKTFLPTTNEINWAEKYNICANAKTPQTYIMDKTLQLALGVRVFIFIVYILKILQELSVNKHISETS